MAVRTHRSCGFLLCAFVAVTSLLSALTSVAQTPANILYVKASSTGNNTGDTWSDAFLDLQDALAAAVAGDEIWVASGVYIPGATDDVHASFELKNGVGIFGGFIGSETARNQRHPEANPTILSGDLQQDDIFGAGVWYQGWNRNTDNSAHVVTSPGVDSTAVLDGFTVTAGATGATGTIAGSPDMYGGGLYNIGGDPTIIGCTFLRNISAFAHGGAVYNATGSPTFQRCEFIQNWVHLGHGGGIYNWGASGPLIEDCTFIENRSIGASPEPAGGAIAHRATVPMTVRRCYFEYNISENFYPTGALDIARGGGIHCFTGGMTVDSCTFYNNRSNAGGGIFNWVDGTVIANCLFMGNTVTAYDLSGSVSGGGYGAGVATSSFGNYTTTIVNSTFSRNNAGEGGGVATVWNHLTVLQNCVLWGNTGIGQDITLRDEQYKGNTDVLYTCVEGLLDPIPGEDPPDPANYPGSIDTDPLFADSASWDFHLLPGSPCIDAGDNSAVPAWLTQDLDGRDRKLDDPSTSDTGSGSAPLVDMGVYEFQSPPPVALWAVF